MKIVCAECGVTFSAPPAWKKRCCTRACSDVHRKKKRMKPCAHCFAMFLPHGGCTDTVWLSLGDAVAAMAYDKAMAAAHGKFAAPNFNRLAQGFGKPHR
jgi:hypothetical protein